MNDKIIKLLTERVYNKLMFLSENLQEKDAFNYKAAKAALAGKKDFKFKGKSFKVTMSKSNAEKIVKESEKLNNVMNDISEFFTGEKNKESLDDSIKNLDERKKRKKKYTAKNIPNNYKSKVSSKARSSMAREMNKCAKTPRPKSCYDYWDADKKHDKAMSESIDRFVEMLYEKKLSEKTRKSLKKKAEKANMPLGALTSVYRKGLGAWLTGHRPGTPQHAWAMARVNSFISGGKTRSVDKAEWKKVQKHRKK